MPHPTITVAPWPSCGPAEAAARLRGRPHLVWLDSALARPRTGRWSIVASDPRWVMTARGSDIEIKDARGIRHIEGDPLACFAALVEAEPRVDLDAAHVGLPFAGGAIGYLGFELGRFVERLPATTVDDVGAPDLAIGWYDAALVWDGDAALAGWSGHPRRSAPCASACGVPPRPPPVSPALRTASCVPTSPGRGISRRSPAPVATSRRATSTRSTSRSASRRRCAPRASTSTRGCAK